MVSGTNARPPFPSAGPVVPPALRDRGSGFAGFRPRRCCVVSSWLSRSLQLLSPTLGVLIQLQGKFANPLHLVLVKVFTLVVLAAAQSLRPGHPDHYRHEHRPHDRHHLQVFNLSLGNPRRHDHIRQPTASPS